MKSLTWCPKEGGSEGPSPPPFVRLCFYGIMDVFDLLFYFIFLCTVPLRLACAWSFIINRVLVQGKRIKKWKLVKEKEKTDRERDTWIYKQIDWQSERRGNIHDIFKETSSNIYKESFLVSPINARDENREWKDKGWSSQ